MGWYTVSLHCTRGGEIHGVIGGLWGGLQIEGSPDREGTIAELYAGRSLPPELVEFIDGKVWRDGVKDHVTMAGPARVVIKPR